MKNIYQIEFDLEITKFARALIVVHSPKGF